MNVAIPILDIDCNKNIIATGLNVNGFLCLYDNNNETSFLMRTLDLASDMGQLLPALEKKYVSIIITEQIHPMALKVLVNKGFVVYRSQGKSVEDNLVLYKNKKLVPFNMDGAMDFAEACGGACSSCATECADDKKDEN